MGIDGKHDSEGGAPTGRVVDFDVAAMVFDQVLHDRESQSLSRPLVAGAIVALEQVGPVLGGNTGPLILYLNHNEEAALSAVGKSPHQDAMGLAVLDRIVEKVIQDPSERTAVGQQIRELVGDFQCKREAPPSVQGGMQSDGLFQKILQTDAFMPERNLIPEHRSERGQFVGEGGETLCQRLDTLMERFALV